MIINPVMYSGRKLPELDNPGTAADLLAGKQLVDQYGNPLTGTMPQRSASNLTASGKTVTVPAGYYPSQVSKSVATATQATPSITVDSAGKITASATQSAGYVSAGTKSATKQLLTKSGTTITPKKTAQTAVVEQRFTTGDIIVAGDANLVAENIKSGVSIFGVTGNLDAIGPRNFDVINDTSVRQDFLILAVNADGDNVSEAFTLSKNTRKTFSLMRGGVLVVCIKNDINGRGTAGVTTLESFYETDGWYRIEVMELGRTVNMLAYIRVHD